MSIADIVLLAGASTILLSLWAVWRPGRDHPANPAQIRGFFRFVNAVGRIYEACLQRPLFWFDPGRLEKELISIKIAEHRIFGSPDSSSEINRLHALFHGLEAPGSILSTMGRFSILRELRARLRHRQQIVAYVRSHPEVLKVPIRHPLIVLGLPRTGSTLLQNLLAADPRSRSPHMWEIRTDPSPRPLTADEISNMRDPRIKSVERALNSRRLISPDYSDLVNMYHEIEAPNVEEIALLIRECMWNEMDIIYVEEDESYEQWLLNNDEDKTYIYRYIKVWLQIQSSTYTPASHWVLKAPSHSFFIPALVKEFPDANLVFTYRDPCSVVASFCKFTLVAGALRIDFHKYDPHRLGERILDFLKTAGDLIHHFQNSENGVSKRAFHLQYEDLIADPIATVEQIYTHFGYQMTDQFRVNMNEHLANNPQHKHGKPDYSLEQFGLDKAMVQKALENYNKTFIQ